MRGTVSKRLRRLAYGGINKVVDKHYRRNSQTGLLSRYDKEGIELKAMKATWPVLNRKNKTMIHQKYQKGERS